MRIKEIILGTLWVGVLCGMTLSLGCGSAEKPEAGPCTNPNCSCIQCPCGEDCGCLAPIEV